MRRSRKYGIVWVAVLATLAVICVPAWRRGSSLEHPRPVADVDLYSPRALDSVLRALHLRPLLRQEGPPLHLDTQQEAALTACIALSRLVHSSVNGVAQFDAPAVRDQLLDWQRQMSPPFYAQFLLAKWHERRGTADEARAWMQKALEGAPAVLIRKYQFMDGTPLAHTRVGTLGMECRMQTAGSADLGQGLSYIDLVTDEKGQVYLPCYDTKICCSAWQNPEGYETETGRHGYLEIRARYSLLPTVYVWKKGEPRPATDLPPSTFYAYNNAHPVKGLTYRVEDVEFRIDRCFRLGQDGTVSAGDGRNPVVLSEEDPVAFFGAPLPCLDQATVRFKRNTTAGHAILQVQVFDHRSRGLLTEYHAPAAWWYDGQDEIHLRSFAKPLPESVDVWFRISKFEGQDQVQQVPARVGATAEFDDYKAVLTHLHSGARSYSSTNNVVTFGPAPSRDVPNLQVAFQITAKQAPPEGLCVWLVAVSKTGGRLTAGHMFRTSQRVFVCDFPMKLSDLDHFELPAPGRDLCFFFDGVSLPTAGDRELTQSWQAILPTRGQAGTFATTGPAPAHVQITLLPGRSSLSLESWHVSDLRLSQAYWTYGSERRDLDSYTTILCEMTGLTARMLKTQIEPLDAGGKPLTDRHGSGWSGGVVYGAFHVSAPRIDAVRVTLSWSAE